VPDLKIIYFKNNIPDLGMVGFSEIQMYEPGHHKNSSLDK
jgi:hypothetical protein